ncbi:uncharacterized protein LOC113913014 [Zalophus californianus]|uniref:Uncharacterized protein LOC113913014 n=1 Tax=Zalophus californianus TaxID=9704 RepID=A0A6J2BLA9_ZALCA|nr:uncharacterized protein LOC113913014 [Zalophus californianus]
MCGAGACPGFPRAPHAVSLQARGRPRGLVALRCAPPWARWDGERRPGPRCPPGAGSTPARRAGRHAVARHCRWSPRRTAVPEEAGLRACVLVPRMASRFPSSLNSGVHSLKRFATVASKSTCNGDRHMVEWKSVPEKWPEHGFRWWDPQLNEGTSARPVLLTSRLHGRLREAWSRYLGSGLAVPSQGPRQAQLVSVRQATE